jgi:hypothetical protein
MDVPDRTATDRYVNASGRGLDYSFDVVLGELTPGHHVIARGIGQAPTVDLPDDADLPRDIIDHVEKRQSHA